MHVSGETATFIPWDDDVGTHVFYISAFDLQNNLIMQTIYLTIMASKEIDILTNSSLTAKIDSISRNGNVVILFSELLKIPTLNYTNQTNATN